jgi:hypothetical protein
LECAIFHSQFSAKMPRVPQNLKQLRLNSKLCLSLTSFGTQGGVHFEKFLIAKI